MSRTSRAIPHYRQKQPVDNDLYASSPSYLAWMNRFYGKAGHDGSVKNTLYGPDSSFPKGFNTYDDYGTGLNGKRFCKRAAGRARRRISKRVVSDEASA